jgi:hypothetical protein
VTTIIIALTMLTLTTLCIYRSAKHKQNRRRRIDSAMRDWVNRESGAK